MVSTLTEIVMRYDQDGIYESVEIVYKFVDGTRKFFFENSNSSPDLDRVFKEFIQMITVVDETPDSFVYFAIREPKVMKKLFNIFFYLDTHAAAA